MEVGHCGIPMGTIFIGIPMMLFVVLAGPFAIVVTAKIKKSHPFRVWALRIGIITVFAISFSWLREALWLLSI